MQIRITAAVVMLGSTQLLRGQQLDAPEELAIALAESQEAALVPFAEQATMPRLRETAVTPRPVSKPKPPNKGRR